MAAERDSQVRYRFGPLERRGIVAGWRGGQIATVAAGLVVAVFVVRVDSSPGSAVAALFVVATAVGAATWPVGGRTLEEWAPDAVRYAAGSRRRRRTGANPFSTLRVLPVQVEGSSRSEAGVILDETTRTYCAVLRSSGTGFALASEEDKLQRISAWAGVLSALARDGSAVHRVQWVARSAPTRHSTRHSLAAADADDTRDDGLDDTRAGSQFESARRSYSALFASHSQLSHRQEVLMAVSVRPGRGAHSVKSASSHTGACTLLLREAAALRRRLLDAGIDATNLLSPMSLERAFRGAFEPSMSATVPESDRAAWSGMSAAAGVYWNEEGRLDRSENGRASTHVPFLGERSGGWPWPMGISAEWGRAQVERAWHVTYWISEWPRTEVGPDFLGPLLLMNETATTVSVVMEPLGPIQAARRIEQARTADMADSELRRRGGFLATARRRREEETLAQREVELADGHAPYRFSGYVRVSAADVDELEESCGRTEQAAARCGLELRVCYGDQARAFCATLPLCRGLS